MLHYFPIPRPDELLYSVFARYAVHTGIVSPKQCLDDLFNCRTAVATVDLPSHLNAFCNNAAHLWDISVDDLIYRHTLFPLYAPFVPDKRRHSAMSHMRSNKGGAQHMELGVAASIVKPPVHMRYCPTCLTNQQMRFGEYYWPRAWHVAGVNVCALHGSLINTGIRFRPSERHRYVPATPTSCISSLQRGEANATHKMERAVCNLASQLMNLSPRTSPTYHQWSRFYQDLAVSNGFTRGSHVLHQNMFRQLLCVWSGSEQDVITKMSSWLPSLFRKHRKSFSHAQHLVVWATLMPSMSASEILRQVLAQPRQPVVSICQIRAPSVADSATTSHRDHWQQSLLRFNHRGAKWVRENLPGMAATYAWLYRNDRQWLLAVNKQWRLKHRENSHRVNWRERDINLSRKLQSIIPKSDSNSGRRTRTWLINQLPHSASVAKNLEKLPLCNHLLTEISESVADYQIRRCKHAIDELRSLGLSKTRWRVEKRAGISSRSIRPSTKRFLMSLEEGACGQNNNPKHSK